MVMVADTQPSRMAAVLWCQLGFHLLNPVISTANCQWIGQAYHNWACVLVISLVWFLRVCLMFGRLFPGCPLCHHRKVTDIVCVSGILGRKTSRAPLYLVVNRGFQGGFLHHERFRLRKWAWLLPANVFAPHLRIPLLQRGLKPERSERFRKILQGREMSVIVGYMFPYHYPLSIIFHH